MRPGIKASWKNILVDVTGVGTVSFVRALFYYRRRFLTLEQWKHPERIFSLCTLCAAPRGEDSAAELREYAARYRKPACRTVVADFIPACIPFFTRIRALAAERKEPGRFSAEVREQGHWAARLLPPGCREGKRRIPMTFEQYRQESNARFPHPCASQCLCCAGGRQAGAALRSRSPKSADGGNWHDSTRSWPVERAVANDRAIWYNIKSSGSGFPKLLHAISGMAARNRFGVTDDELGAMDDHNITARAGMTLLEKVVCLADYIPAIRDHKTGAEKLRVGAYRDMDGTLLECLAFTICELSQKNRTLSIRRTGRKPTTAFFWLNNVLRRSSQIRCKSAVNQLRKGA